MKKLISAIVILTLTVILSTLSAVVSYAASAEVEALVSVFNFYESTKYITNDNAGGAQSAGDRAWKWTGTGAKSTKDVGITPNNADTLTDAVRAERLAFMNYVEYVSPDCKDPIKYMVLTYRNPDGLSKITQLSNPLNETGSGSRYTASISIKYSDNDYYSVIVDVSGGKLIWRKTIEQRASTIAFYPFGGLASTDTNTYNFYLRSAAFTRTLEDAKAYCEELWTTGDSAGYHVNGGELVIAPVVPKVDITLDKHAYRMSVGGKLTLSVDTDEAATVTFESSNTNVATVENGVITAVTNGETEITVTATKGELVGTDKIKIYVIDEISPITVDKKADAPVAPAVMPKITFLGDSITAGSQTSKTYHSYLADRLYITAVNKGLSGSNIAGVGSSNQASFIDRVSQIPDDTDLIFVMGGTNDFGQNAGTLDRFVPGIRTLIESLITRFPDKPIVFSTPLQNGGYFSITTNNAGETLAQYVDEIEKACAEYGIPVIKTYRNAAFKDFCIWDGDTVTGYNETYYADGVHPNAAGHEVMADLFEKELEKVMHLFEKALRESAETSDKTQFSIKATKDGTKYVKLDGNIFLKEDGTEMSSSQAYNALIGKKITLEDGDVITFIKKLPDRNVYKELFKKLPGYEEGIDVKAVSESINKNIVEVITASEAQTRNEAQRRPHIGIKDFDQREVYIADESDAYRLELCIANLTDGTKIAYVKRYIERAGQEIAEKIKKAETAEQIRLNQPLDGEDVETTDTTSTGNSISQLPKNVNTQFSLSKGIENFDNSWYNEITLSSAERNRVQSEALTWNADKRNQLITQTLSNDVTYRYMIDDDGIVHIYGRETAVNIHERKKEYDNANGKRPDSITEELWHRQGYNSEFVDISQDGRKPSKDDTNDNYFVPGEGRSDRTGYSEVRTNAHRKPNGDGNEIAPTNEVSSTDDAFFDGENTKYSLSKDNNGNQNPTDNPDIRYSVSNSPLDNGTDLVYNENNLYTSSDSFIHDVSIGDRNTFSRSLANKTADLGKDEIRTVEIYGANKVYYFEATGYMQGQMLYSANVDDIADYTRRKEHIYAKDGNRRLFNRWSSILSSDRGRKSSDIYSIENRRAEADVYGVYGDSRKSNGTGTQERIRQNFEDDPEKVERIVSELRKQYGFTENHSTNEIAPIKEVSSTDDAFFDGEKTDVRYSLSNEGEQFAPTGNYSTPLNETALDIAPVATDDKTVPVMADGDMFPVVENATTISADVAPAEQTVDEKISAKLQNLQTELENNKKLRDESIADFDSEIARLQAEYDAKKDKNTKVANNLLRRIERIERLKANVTADYDSRINSLEARAEKMQTPQYRRGEQRRAKQVQFDDEIRNLIGDISTWVDKKLGISYQTNTLHRNLRDVVRDANGNQDIAKADAIYEYLQGSYNHNEAQLKQESRAIKQKYADMKINKYESEYIQMLGEFKYNPNTKLTREAVDEYFNKHKNRIDLDKVNKAIEESRKDYDNLIKRVNAVLREQGMKEIGYKEGYYPHFTDTKQSLFAKLLNWKTIDTEIPTDIAGLTEDFEPVRTYQSFDKHRKSDETDYNFLKGFDTYVHGALDWIYHIEDIQKRRAFEHEIRYRHSEQGIRDKIDEIRKKEDIDADEVYKEIDAVYTEARNPLNNFVTDLRNSTNNLAGKKSTADREMEYATNRKIYSTMTNISNRVSGNMVVGSISSALTNFIPITQSWGQVSPISSLVAMRDTIRNAYRDDGMIKKSDFMTNRLLNEENLNQTGWDKASNVAGGLMNIFDHFTTEVVWRSKYQENMNNGMSEAEAIHDADIFAENVMAGRSRGNMPTIYNSKNPITKMLTAFQLEVANQYGYMFKDLPQDVGKENIGKLTAGYAKMFVGAYLYNALFSALTGRDVAFDPIGILEDLMKDLGFGGDDEEDEADVMGALYGLGENVAQEIPYIGGLLGGGRVPISSAIPYDNPISAISGTAEDISGAFSAFNDAEGSLWEKAEKTFKTPESANLAKEWLKPFYYVGMPFGGGQLKKSIEGWNMFSDEHPVSGSYTDSGNLRFPVEDTPLNRIQAGIFGQYASKNAREYFDNDYAPLKEKQIQEYIDVDLPIADYWKYREGLSGLKKNAEKADYINSLDIEDWQKNLLMNNILDRKEDVDMSNYDDFSDWEEFDYAQKNPEKYAFAKSVGGYSAYKTYSDELNDIKADKDASGKSITGSRKEKVLDYINNLNADYETKIILWKSEYQSDDTYNMEIINYINNRTDLTYEERVAIFTELGFTVSDGSVYWD